MSRRGDQARSAEFTAGWNRRRFIVTAGLGLTVLAGALGRARGEPRLTILHTNDTHSRIDPFPDGFGGLSGLGGVARRKTLIDRIRSQEERVLLLDSGDIFQGTPYFNLYGGRVEIECMNRLGYDVATLGNHEFDNGIEGLSERLPEARFEWVAANLDLSGSPEVASRVKPWAIRDCGPFRVGIFGLLCRLEGLVSPRNYEGVGQLDPVASAREVVAELRRRGCNLIVCLSHLGFASRGSEGEFRDEDLPRLVEGVDLVLGGHSHTFIDELAALPRRGGGKTRITQQGWGGVRLGRLDVALRPGGGAAIRQQILPIGAC